MGRIVDEEREETMSPVLEIQIDSIETIQIDRREETKSPVLDIQIDRQNREKERQIEDRREETMSPVLDKQINRKEKKKDRQKIEEKRL